MIREEISADNTQRGTNRRCGGGSLRIPALPGDDYEPVGDVTTVQIRPSKGASVLKRGQLAGQIERLQVEVPPQFSCSGQDLI